MDRDATRRHHVGTRKSPLGNERRQRCQAIPVSHGHFRNHPSFLAPELSLYFRSRPHHRSQAKTLRGRALVCAVSFEVFRADQSNDPYGVTHAHFAIVLSSAFASKRGRGEQNSRLALTDRGSLVVDNEAVCRPLNHVIRTQAGLERRKGHLQ